MSENNELSSGFISINKVDLLIICKEALENIKKIREEQEEKECNEIIAKYNETLKKGWFTRFYKKEVKFNTLIEAKEFLDKMMHSGSIYNEFGFIRWEYNYTCYWYSKTETKIKELIKCSESYNVDSKILVDISLYSEIIDINNIGNKLNV